METESGHWPTKHKLLRTEQDNYLQQNWMKNHSIKLEPCAVSHTRRPKNTQVSGRRNWSQIHGTKIDVLESTSMIS